jgi:hypothetical protein
MIVTTLVYIFTLSCLPHTENSVIACLVYRSDPCSMHWLRMDSSDDFFTESIGPACWPTVIATWSELMTDEVMPLFKPNSRVGTDVGSFRSQLVLQTKRTVRV